jgi:GntR family transcriptional regulator/MocR family aminotransferase
VDLHLSLTRTGRLQSEVYQQLRQAILDGRLRPGEALPATRELAGRLEVGRNTVVGAYQRLAAEGFLVGRMGAGTFVAAPSHVLGRRAPSGAVLRPRRAWLSLAEAPAPRPQVPFDFSLGAPDPGLFPWDEWRRLMSRQLRGRRLVAGYPPPEGDARLRAAVARHVGLSRAVRADADDVLVCAGAQQAFDLIGRVLVEPGECVAVEDPGYPPVRQALQMLGARVVPVPVDAEGLEVERLPRDARLVYVTPSHQFPLGTPMSLARRLALLAWSERHGAAIVEDDYDSEFRFDGRPLDPLQSLDRSGRVLYVGTFSKVLLPTLRLGFVVAPASLMPSLRAARRLADSHGPLEMQRALAELLEDGFFVRHLRHLHREYRTRRDRLVAAIDRELAGALVRLPGAAGLHLSARCRDDTIDADAWARTALEAGVAIESLAVYHRRDAGSGLAFGYGLIPVARIDEGVARLAACLPRPRARARGGRAGTHAGAGARARRGR